VLVGQSIADSNEINKLVDQLTAEVQQKNQTITGVRPPNPELAIKMKSLGEKALKLRGRAMTYPYVGTGAGRGPYVELEDGSVKLDLINGIGVHLMGHGHPKVIRATIRGALSDVTNQGNLQMNKELLDMCEFLVSKASKSSRLKFCWTATCGTMANENALKMARQKNSPARYVLAMEGAFAGRSTMMAEVTDNAAYREGLPEYQEILRVPYFDKKNPKSAEQALAKVKEHVAKHEKNISTFVFEPMLGEGGYRVATREFFQPILQFCKEQKIAVWADEVQTFARTGELFAFETLGIGEYIDLCTIAKTAQIGATLYTEEYNPKPGLVAGTYAGATTALTAGLENLRILCEENYLGPHGKIAQIHKSFM
jgi:acetylornithine/N-succinyldiaminopimelate aminotransferase